MIDQLIQKISPETISNYFRKKVPAFKPLPENLNHILREQDFAEFSHEVPGVFSFIGIGNQEKGTTYPHHHPRFNLDEEMLSVGVEMHVKTALAYLAD